VIFPPFLALQTVGLEQIEIVAGMVVSKVRVNVHLNKEHNLKGLKNILKTGKTTHLAHFEYLLKELEQLLLLLAKNDQTNVFHDTDLESLREGCLSLLDMVLHQYSTHLKRNQTIDALDLLDHCKLRIMVMKSIGVLDTGKEILKGLIQTPKSQAAAFANFDRHMHSGWQHLQEKNLANHGHELAEMALKLSKIKGLVHMMLSGGISS
jgi:hypothetical protein